MNVFNLECVGSELIEVSSKGDNPIRRWGLLDDNPEDDAHRKLESERKRERERETDEI